MSDLDAIEADLNRRVPALDPEDRSHARGLLIEARRMHARLDAVRALHRRSHAIFAWAGENVGVRYEAPPRCATDPWPLRDALDLLWHRAETES